MSYYPAPPPPREDPITRILRELVNLSSKVDQLSRSLTDISTRLRIWRIGQ
ncbi:hypothetical protein [Vulcanisaeta sp. JCM 14467]|uniref:hypothetical protein n=1 Tax=Vulcanisaeta sp. JCM 14467 TaxID=1295370 RepID=UPI000B1D3A06|nr:hypothetical protein [Vulcanisaeta sp. JCM 14467]